MQKQCIWCGKLGPRFEPIYGVSTPKWALPHADGTSCRCRCMTYATAGIARREGGRYWDAQRRQWRCFGCHTRRQLHVIRIDKVPTQQVAR